MAELREVPFGLYYGSVDATPLFVMLAGLYVEHTGDDETLHALWPNIEAALGWIDGAGDPDGDGFVEYSRADEERPCQPGLEGFAGRDLPRRRLRSRKGRSRCARCRAMSMRQSAWPPAARCGLAKIELGDCARRRRPLSSPHNLSPRSGATDFGTYALALDGEKRPCRVRTSNAGQVLFSGIAAPDRARSSHAPI